MFDRERTIQMHSQKSDLPAFSVEFFDNSLDRFTGTAHSDDDFFRIRSTIIVEQTIFTSSQLVDLVHIFFNDTGQSFIVRVYSFTGLEIDIRILSSAANDRIIGIEPAITESSDRIIIDQFSQIIISQSFYFLNFVGSTETVKEVNKRNTTFDSRQMSHCRQIHNFLYSAFSKQRKTCLACSHNVLVVAENRQ